MIGPTPFVSEPETTGRYLVLLRQDAVDSGIQAMRDSAGIANVARASDFDAHALKLEEVKDADSVVFDSLGVAVVTIDPDQLQSLNVTINESSPIAIIEPERVVHALSEIGIPRVGQLMPTSTTNVSMEYLKGYRDAVDSIVDKVVSPNGTHRASSLLVEVPRLDETTATWGLQVTRVLNSRYSGHGIKVAVLDTGLDLNHPDFEGRMITSKSFVLNQAVQDKQGHGTHCIGTACGPLNPPNHPPRYGIAYNGEIFVGKVLNNQGSGTDTNILAGIEWAIANGCHIISMSLGASVFPGQHYSNVFEVAADRSLRNGTLIIAAAGNDSDRRTGRMEDIWPVSHPANCPSIMAVAALDSNLQVAWFSNSGLNLEGGQVDIAGPGVDVHSSYPIRTGGYRRLSGTSMATPHVAGIAALFAEATGASGRILWNLLTQNALRLTIPSVDVGAGLVQAP